MQLFAYRNTMAGAEKIAKGGHAYAQRKAAESRRAAMDEARKAIAKAERAAFDSKARSQLARLFEEAANRVERKRGGVISFRTIERRICRVFKVSPEMLRSRAGRVEYATARMALMYWARRLTKLSSTELGLRCGRDHSTVRHGVDKYVTKRARQGRTLRRLPKAIFSGRSWANGIRTTGKDTHP